jgi:hypothetical protein
MSLCDDNSKHYSRVISISAIMDQLRFYVKAFNSITDDIYCYPLKTLNEAVNVLSFIISTDYLKSCLYTKEFAELVPLIHARINIPCIKLSKKGFTYEDIHANDVLVELFDEIYKTYNALNLNKSKSSSRLQYIYGSTNMFYHSNTLFILFLMVVSWIAGFLAFWIIR